MEIRRGQQTLIGFPALIDGGDAVTIEVFDEPELAAARHRAGLRRLFALQVREPLKYLERAIPDLQKMAVAYMALGTADELKEQIVAVALEPVVARDGGGVELEPRCGGETAIEVVELRELVAERGMALILISHDLGVIAQNVSRMLVMYGGSVVESGPTEAVFDRMAHPYTRGLFAARPRLGPRPPGSRPALATIAGTVPELVDLPAGCAFAGRCALSTAQCEQQRPVARQVSSPDASEGVGPHLVNCWHSPELPTEAHA